MEPPFLTPRTRTGTLLPLNNFLNVKPGTYREYSNISAGLAGYIVEIAAGEKLNAYTKRHIFAPLKMDNTGWFPSEIALAKHSTLYDRQGDSTTRSGCLDDHSPGGVSAASIV